ncbi:glycosyltransferase [Streptomyces blastmyceticus]|uniref:Glycosyltransferase n=1 Tax=Streptomyces blastmyceticus TaxID=68180 RepID=A0ABP3G0U9_9ACTN
MLNMSTPVRRASLIVAAALAAAAVVQQLLVIAGFGGWLPGWQPWPYLLAAVPAFLFGGPRWASTDRSLPGQRVVAGVRRIPVWMGVAGVMVIATAVWAVLQAREPYIGHEEAVYANKARSWVSGAPDAGWGVYRPVGLPAVGYVALTAHNSVGALRAVALILVLFTLGVTYFIAARWTTPRRAVVVVLVLLSGLGFLRRVPEYLNDIGSTGLLLLVVFLITRAQERAESRALLAIPFVVVPAFYFRYGIAGNLLAICVAALLAYGPRAWSMQWRNIAIAGALIALGLVPHFVYAVRATGSPLGVVSWATSQANRAYFGDGLVYYLSIFPYRLAGDLGAVVMSAGIIAAAVAMRRRSRIRSPKVHGGPEDRRRAFLGTASVLIIVALGLTSHGEPRFVYVPVVLLTVLGVQALAEYSGRWSATVLTGVAAFAALSVLGTAQVVGQGAMRGPHLLSESTVPVARELSAPGPCLVVSGYEPEMGWYSGCDAVTYAEYREAEVPADVKVQFVLFERGRLQPGPSALKELVGTRKETTRTIPTEGSLGRATVVSLD